jgi:phosphoenolpyruvate carboxykinase (GTP)
VPRKRDLHVEGLRLSDRAIDTLLDVDPEGWREEVAGIGDYLDSFGARMPAALKNEQRRIASMIERLRTAEPASL